MTIFTIFLFSLLFLVALLLTLNNLFNSRWFRIALINYQQREREKEIVEEQEKIRMRTLEEIENPDQMMEMMMKIKKGEEVKIPLAAFDYLYRNLDKYTIVDKQGKLTFINREDYFRFKKHYEFLLAEHKEEGEINVKSIVKDMVNKTAEQPIEITEYEDGTIVKKDHISHTVEILKPNGEKIFVDLKNDTMITENLIEKKEEKTNTKDRKEKEKNDKKETHEKKFINDRIRKLEQKNKELEEKLNSSFIAKTSEESEEIIDENSVDFEDDFVEEKDKIISKEVKGEIQNETESVVTKEDIIMSKKPKIKSQNDKEDEDDFFFLDDEEETVIGKKPKKQNLKQEIKKSNKISDDNPQPPSDFYFSFIDTNDFLETQIKHNRVTVLLHYILTYNKINAQQCVIYDAKADALLIDINWFAYKIWYLIKAKEERQLFLENYYENIDAGIINNEFLSKLIEKFNMASAFGIGSKVFYQEQKDGKVFNFKSVKFENSEGVLHQGLFLHLFTTNSFGKKFKELPEFSLIANNGFTICESKSKGKKSNFNDIIKLEHV